MEEKNIQENILNAATIIFVEKGKAGARMQEIADKAGVNKMLLHYYFRNKDLLFQEVVKQIINDLYKFVMIESFNSQSFKEVLNTFINRHFEFLYERRKVLHFFLWELSCEKIDLKETVLGTYAKFGGNPFEALEKKLNEAMQKGEIRQVKPADFIINLFSLNLFLFIALPFIQAALPIDEQKISFMIEQRKNEIFRLLWNDIKIN